MRFDLTLALFLILFLLLSITHSVGMQFELYRIYPWFDIPMHFWGGALITLGSASPLFSRIFRFYPDTLAKALLLVLIIGGIWEIFEWYAGIAGIVAYLATIIPDYHTLWMLDTVKDLVLDLLGGVVGYVVAQSIKNMIDR